MYVAYIMYTGLGKSLEYIFYTEPTENNLSKLFQIINNIAMDVSMFFHVSSVIDGRPVEGVVRIFIASYVEWYLILKVTRRNYVKLMYYCQYYQRLFPNFYHSNRLAKPTLA